MFKVVPDQLRISQGWVRCGHCNEVFDASAQMLPPHEQAALSGAPVPIDASQPRGGADAAVDVRAQDATGQPASGAAASVPHTEPISWQTLAPPEASVPEATVPPDASAPVMEEERLATGVEAATVQPLPWRTRAPVPAEPAQPHDSEAEPSARAPPTQAAADEPPAPAADTAVDARREPVFDLDEPPTAVDAMAPAVAPPAPPAVDDAPLADRSPAPASETADEMAPSPAEPMIDVEVEVEVEPTHVPAADDAGDVDRVTDTPAPTTLAPDLPGVEAPPAPSFVAAAQRRAFWSSRPMRIVSWLALLALLLALLLQAVASRRDWLAAREPRLAPVLQALCQPLGCQLAPYRQLEAIVIDSSAFNRATATSFRFSVTLRNLADLPVATPALELTLTDLQDQPLVRRVLGPAELGAPPALAAHGEFSASHVITLNASAASTAVTGYRLMAFYP